MEAEERLYTRIKRRPGSFWFFLPTILSDFLSAFSCNKEESAESITMWANGVDVRFETVLVWVRCPSLFWWINALVWSLKHHRRNNSSVQVCCLGNRSRVSSFRPENFRYYTFFFLLAGVGLPEPMSSTSSAQVNMDSDVPADMQQIPAVSSRAFVTHGWAPCHRHQQLRCFIHITAVMSSPLLCSGSLLCS